MRFIDALQNMGEGKMYLKVPRDMKKGEYGWFELVQSPEEILRAMREGRVMDMETGAKILVNDTTEDNLCYGEADGGAEIIDAWCDGYQEGRKVKPMIRETKLAEAREESWSEGYTEGYKNGKINGRLELLESFLTVPLDTDISFELSEHGKEVYRKGLWRTLRTLYGSYMYLQPNDRLILTMNFVGFAKIFGQYIRKHGTEAFADLIKDRSVRLNEVTIKFKEKKLTNIREVTLSDKVL